MDNNTPLRKAGTQTSSGYTKSIDTIHDSELGRGDFFQHADLLHGKRNCSLRWIQYIHNTNGTYAFPNLISAF